MSQFVFKMPDLGEGTVEAEIVAWHIEARRAVSEDQVIVEVMTDKAAVEVPAPVSGRVVSVTGAPGDKVAVGSPLIVFEVGAPAAPRAEAAAAAPAPAAAPARGAMRRPLPAAPRAGIAAATPHGGAVRQRRPRPSHDLAGQSAARARGRHRLGDRRRHGTGRAHRARRSGRGGAQRGVRRARRSRIAQAEVPPDQPAAASAAGETTEIKVIGLRRLIAERMSEAKRSIPHFAYVEEVDVTELEALRQHLNSKLAKGEPTFTLPAVDRVWRLARVLESFPQCNVLYDAARGVLIRHRAVHVGHRHADSGWAQSTGGAQCPIAGIAGARRRDPPRDRARAHEQGDAR